MVAGRNAKFPVVTVHSKKGGPKKAQVPSIAQDGNAQPCRSTAGADQAAKFQGLKFGKKTFILFYPHPSKNHFYIPLVKRSGDGLKPMNGQATVGIGCYDDFSSCLFYPQHNCLLFPLPSFG